MYKYIKFLFIFLLASCENSKEIKYDLPFQGAKNVFYGFLVNGGKSRIEVLQITPVLDENPDFSNEKIESIFLVKENKIIDTFTKMNNLFFYDKILISDAKYLIKIKSKEGVFNSDLIQIPQQTIIKKCDFSFNKDTSILKLKLAFEDNPLTEDYYIFNLKKYIKGKIIQELFQSDNQLFSFHNITKDENLVSSIYLDDVITKTPIFDNGKYMGLKKIDSLKIELLHISDEYYRFQQSVNSNSVELGSIAAYSNPTWTNIPNAYGVIGGVTVSEYTIKLK